MTAIKESPQLALEETVLDDALLLTTLDAYLKNQSAAKAFRGLRRSIKEYITLADLPPGWYRCGPYRLFIKDITGGNITIGSWVSKGFSVH